MGRTLVRTIRYRALGCKIRMQSLLDNLPRLIALEHTAAMTASHRPAKPIGGLRSDTDRLQTDKASKDRDDRRAPKQPSQRWRQSALIALKSWTFPGAPVVL